METQDNAQFHIVLVKGWVEKDGKFLLAQRSTKELHKGGSWSLPGGKVEDEVEEAHILENTLRKEIQEEVGLTVDRQMSLIYNNSFVRVDGAHVVGLTFLCKALSGEAEALEDTAAVQWLSLEELKNFSDAEDFLKLEIEHLENYLITHQ